MAAADEWNNFVITKSEGGKIRSAYLLNDMPEGATVPYLPMAVRSLFLPLSSVAAHIGVQHFIFALRLRRRAIKRLRICRLSDI